MEARELRIGNLLTVLGGTVIVAGLSSIEERPDMYWVHTKEYIPTKIFHFKPIELTEQWLLDFGFTRVKWSDNWLRIRTRKRCIYFEVNLKEKRTVIYRIDSNACDFKFTKFVHEVQNAYFSVTGQELTLNK